MLVPRPLNSIQLQSPCCYGVATRDLSKLYLAAENPGFCPLQWIQGLFAAFCFQPIVWVVNPGGSQLFLRSFRELFSESESERWTRVLTLGRGGKFPFGKEDQDWWGGGPGLHGEAPVDTRTGQSQAKESVRLEARTESQGDLGQ